VDGLFPETDPGIPLSELDEGAAAVVLRVPGSKSDLLRYLIELGIEPRECMTLLKRDPFGGPLHLKMGRRTVLLGPEAARSVFVAPVQA
jgi:DtxR family Mn-dependent transcriptional regulator